MTKRSRGREAVLSIASILAVTLVTLGALEIFLRIADFRELRETLTESSLAYDFDPELGWAPVPGSTGTVVSFRTTHYKHNSLGLRDEEFTLDARPTIVFLGDSFVWGVDSEADERFSDLLKPRIPDYKILAAGISLYLFSNKLFRVMLSIGSSRWRSAAALFALAVAPLGWQVSAAAEIGALVALLVLMLVLERKPLVRAAR